MVKGSTDDQEAPLLKYGLSTISISSQRSAHVNSIKYIGLDVHTATISVAVLDAAGKFIMESVVETKASTILQFMQASAITQNRPIVIT